MILLERSVRIRQGKWKEAREWAKSLADYLLESCDDPHVISSIRKAIKPIEVYTPRFGIKDEQLYWTIRFRTLQDLETTEGRWDKDCDYKKLFDEQLAPLIDGSVTDRVFEILESK